MLLTVVHANGIYHAHLGEHEPLKTYDDSWEQDNYHERLAETVGEHLGKGSPVIYLPYWNNAHLTDIFTSKKAQERAFNTDPLLIKLGDVANEALFELYPTTAGRSAELFGHDQVNEAAWRRRLIELAAQEQQTFFVGAYTRACVADVAEMVLSRTGLDVFIDPDLSVDIQGEGYVATDLVAVPYGSLHSQNVYRKI